MQSLGSLLGGRQTLRLLCIGAHCDDIEIGCGATLLRLASERPIEVHCLVLSATPARAREAQRAAERFLERARAHTLRIEALRDGYLPAAWAEAKDIFESSKDGLRPDLIFAPHREDRHQDHRVASELTWNTFRDHTILEYEIPKYDGGLGQPNCYVPVSREVARAKARLLLASFRSQRGRPWFSAETFLALMRLRGVECNAPEGYAEAFHARKVVL
jgi:LmbE family N-acetylglucosaminyl deacetylase